MNYARLNTLVYFDTITSLREKFDAEGVDSEVRELFEYYRLSINSYLIAYGLIGLRFVDTPPELLYNITELNKLKNTYIPGDSVMYEELSSDILA